MGLRKKNLFKNIPCLLNFTADCVVKALADTKGRKPVFAKLKPTAFFVCCDMNDSFIHAANQRAK